MEFTRTALITFLLSASLLSCQRKKISQSSLITTQEFNNYWHTGKAEVSSYDLTQSRYGESRPGKAVLIFVTEDLSRKLQVKSDSAPARDRINVLKLNFTKKFLTGIYPYSLMLSVFTPVDRHQEPATLKATMSSQEWCGQVYTQLNLRGNRYAIKSHSYFEQEADERFSVRHALLEDELWNVIRLDNENLPVGKIDVVPGLFHARLQHTPLKIQRAVGSRSVTDSAFVYTLHFPEDERTLAIKFGRKFPFMILGWKETWSENGKQMATTAVLDKTLHTDYWTKSKNEFLYLRDSLNLHDAF